MGFPVKGYNITAIFGKTNEELDSGGFNKGIDFSVPSGTEVTAVTAGTVISVEHSKTGWGTSIKIRDAQGNVHNYGHLGYVGPNIIVGSTITAGQSLASSGNTGASTGPHLSYDVKNKSGTYIDPSAMLGYAAGSFAGDNRSINDFSNYTRLAEGGPPQGGGPEGDEPPTGAPGADDPYGIIEAGAEATTPSSVLEILRGLRYDDGSEIDNIFSLGIGSADIKGLGEGATQGLLESGIPQFNQDALGGQARAQQTSKAIEDILLTGGTVPDDLLELNNYYQGGSPTPGQGDNDMFNLLNQLMDIYQTATSVGAMSQGAAQSKLNNQVELASKFPNLGPWSPGFGPGGSLANAGFSSRGKQGRPISFESPGAPQDAYNESFQQLLEILGAGGIQDQLGGQGAPAGPQLTPPGPTVEQPPPTGLPNISTNEFGSGPIPGAPANFFGDQEQAGATQTSGGNSILDRTMSFLNDLSQRVPGATLYGNREDFRQPNTLSNQVRNVSAATGVGPLIGDAANYWDLIRGFVR